MHPSELGDRLVVGLQTSQQPHHFHVALALGLQPPRRPHLPQIPVQVQLQQITRIVARSSRLRRLGTHKAQLRHVQPPNERLHDSTHVVDWNQFVQGRGKHRRLLPRLTPDIRHKKMPPLPRGHLLIPYQGRLVFRNRLARPPFLLPNKKAANKESRPLRKPSAKRLCSFLCGQRSHACAALCSRINHLHFVPVIRKFLAAIKAYNISSGEQSGRIAAYAFANSNRKAVMAVPAAEDGVNQFAQHRTLPRKPQTLSPETCITYLDSTLDEKVRPWSGDGPNCWRMMRLAATH